MKGYREYTLTPEIRPSLVERVTQSMDRAAQGLNTKDVEKAFTVMGFGVITGALFSEAMLTPVQETALLLYGCGMGYLLNSSLERKFPSAASCARFTAGFGASVVAEHYIAPLLKNMFS